MLCLHDGSSSATCNTVHATAINASPAYCIPLCPCPWRGKFLTDPALLPASAKGIVTCSDIHATDRPLCVLPMQAAVKYFTAKPWMRRAYAREIGTLFPMTTRQVRRCGVDSSCIEGTA